MNFDSFFLDTLPKSHIPSPVPLFTGREDEVKQYSKLITDDSTRLVTIWGSPGFGKTSTAIEVAHNLSLLGYPVYFFKLHGITTVDKLLSKMLSIFKNNLVDVNLAPIDKLVSIFREIPSPIILILDNIDDLLSSETTSAELEDIFGEFLDSSTNINMILTTRQLLENLRDQVEGFQDVRIRPLSPVSSIKFVRQILPSFSENVVAKVAEISFHVPLTIRLVSSLIKNSCEEMANKVLEELHSPDNFLEHFEKNMQKLFEKPFEQLASADKHALISLTVFASATISKDAAIDVVSGERRALSDALRSLDILVKKSLIDLDRNGEYYSIHPLIYSFIVVKAKDHDYENVLKSSNIRFCSYYLLLFERLNDDFLAGMSVDSAQLEDVMENLSTVMHQSLTYDCENAHHVFRILSKAEIFLFLVYIPSRASDEVFQLFDIAIQKSISDGKDLIKFKLYVSNYFRNVAFSFLVDGVHFDIPETMRKEIEKLSDGTAAKLSCYEGILNICHGNIQDGIKRVEMSLGGLQSFSDHLLLKCLCLQVLTLYYGNNNKFEKSSEFKEMAVKVCMEIGNCNLFLVAEFDFSLSKSQRKELGEPLVLFCCLLTVWSKQFLGDETKRYVCNFVSSLQQQIEREECGSNYLFQILCYGDMLLAVLSCMTGRETFLDTKIELLCKSIENCNTLSNKTLPNMSQKTERLFMCYFLKGSLTKRKDQSIDAYRKALDLSLQKKGEQHITTAACYYKIGKTESSSGNYSSALKVLDHALALARNCGPENFNFQAKIYYQIGITHHSLGNYELAISSFEKALDVIREQSQESKVIANILSFLAASQVVVKDWTSALATSKRALDIRIKLFSEKRIPYLKVVRSYVIVGIVHVVLNNETEASKCLEEALKISNSTENEEECLHEKCAIYKMFINLKINEHFYLELLIRGLRSLHAVGKDKVFLLPLYFTVGSKQLDQGKLKSGIASFQAALDIELDVLFLAHPALLEMIVLRYVKMLDCLILKGKSKVCRKIIKRVLKLAESLPKHRQSYSLFRCYIGQGIIHTTKQEYVSAIQFFEDALGKFCIEADDKWGEYTCRTIVAVAYCHEGRHEDALKSLYEAMSLIKDLDPGESEDQAELFVMVATVAQQLGNRKLTISNLRFAYKMYSNVLGRDHPKTEETYLKYVHALMN